MGKKAEKSQSKEKNTSQILDDIDSYKSSDVSFKCNGNFFVDFNILCKQNQLPYIPAIMGRSKVNITSGSDSKMDKKIDKKQQQLIGADADNAEADFKSEVIMDTPPKTFIIRDTFQYLKPSIQVDFEVADKWETVTQVYIKGWKIDEPMMDILGQCWSALTKLHTINLWNVGLTQDTINQLATFLPQCVNVKTTILDGNVVPDGNWAALIGPGSLIQNLSLRHCQVSDQGVAKLSLALGTAASSNTKLVTLNLSGNLIGDDGAEQLAEALRMNRTLLSLALTSNRIGDRGAVKLAEVLSRFPLHHTEVVARRKLLSEKGHSGRKSPIVVKKGDSKDRPSSVSRSTTSLERSKPKPAPKKKDVKGKDSKEDSRTTIRKEKEDGKAGQKRASGSDISRTSSKTKEKKRDRGRTAASDSDDYSDSLDWNLDSADLLNPLLEQTEYIDEQLWIPGNRVLINLNLSRNKIGEPGVAALLKALQCQIALTFESKNGGPGLMRLITTKNEVSPDNETLILLNELMATRDPFSQPTVEPLASHS